MPRFKCFIGIRPEYSDGPPVSRAQNEPIFSKCAGQS